MSLNNYTQTKMEQSHLQISLNAQQKKSGGCVMKDMNGKRLLVIERIAIVGVQYVTEEEIFRFLEC
jgi:hypothetical protein